MHLSPALFLRIFLPFAGGYFLSYLYRVVNAVLAPDLLRDLSLGPSTLGLLTATYFIAFASAQLPLGILLDRYGPRKIEALLLLVAASGALCFARAESVGLLILGRALIGFGVSACLMAAFKAFTQWFSRDKWALINGFQMAAGGLGALAATSPVKWMLHWTDWRGVFTGLGMVTLLAAVLVYFVVPPKEMEQGRSPFSDQLRGILEIFTSPVFWRIAPLTAFSQASFFAIQGLWASPWLKDVTHLEPQSVVSTLFWIAVSMVIGFISLGSLSERLHRRGISVRRSAVGGMTLFIVVQSALVLGPLNWHRPLWLLFGFFGTSGILAYAALSQSFPAHLSGRVSTAVNLLVFMVAFAGQWIIGVIVGWWPETEPGRFASIGLQSGFGFMLFCQMVSLLWFFLRPGLRQSR
ncbi:MAG: MFS transporter [Desulfobulbus sp.]|nr:MFS transporter [Desulfobulbus sp.]